MNGHVVSPVNVVGPQPVYSPQHVTNPIQQVHASPTGYTQSAFVYQNGYHQNGYPQGHPNGYIHHNGYATHTAHHYAHSPKDYVHHNGYGQNAHHVQKSSSFKACSPSNKIMPSTGSPRGQTESKCREPISMDIDLDSVEPTLLEAFKAEVNGYNTEVELTFGSGLNFTKQLAAFVTNIKPHKMANLITQVLSWKQDIILSETVTTDNGQHSQQKIKNDNHVIDEKPTYVRSVLQLIYHAFLSSIYRDPRYDAFYKQYYETESEESASPKKKSGPHQDVDPFFQCLYECSTLYANSLTTKDQRELRGHLEMITTNIVNVLRLINAVIEWTNAIKTHSIRLVLHDSNIDISLYEFSQMLLTTPLETQHAVWQRIQKNEENQIADSKNLSLCIHILLCIAIKHKTAASKYPNTQNPDQIYAAFLEKIVLCLSGHFLRKSNETENGGIIMEFGDLVEKLPLWLLYCDKMLQPQSMEKNNAHQKVSH